MEENTIAVCGPVDAGKSSLIGVLTRGDLDNGRGLARSNILIHNHEQESGRTSNISLNPIKYKKENNELFLYSEKTKKKADAKKILKINIEEEKINNDKIITFIDLAGHEKYLKTTVYGVTGMFPDYGIIVIGANTGITKLTKEHIGILFYLKIPIIITITKIDLAPKEIYKNLCNKIKQLLTNNSFGKIVYFISDSEKKYQDTNFYINNMIDNSDVIPVISISNKTGTNLQNLHKIIYCLPKVNKWKEGKANKTMVYLDSNFNVPGIGIVVSGTIKGGTINPKQKMFLGPFDGIFKQVTIRSIHNSVREEVEEIGSGVQGCFNIKFVNSKEAVERDKIKKGMVLIDSLENWKNNIVRKFSAKIKILQHSTTIKTGYSPVIHCGPIRQSAKIILINEDYLKCKDTSNVTFKFKNNSEFIEKNMIFFFRDGNTKGVGEITNIN